jgi:hypothetical protein
MLQTANNITTMTAVIRGTVPHKRKPFQALSLLIGKFFPNLSNPYRNYYALGQLYLFLSLLK